MISAAVLIALLALMVSVSKVLSYINGKKAKELETTKEALDEAQEAKSIRDRVAVDDSYRNRVRNFFKTK